jgi:DNA-binding GntR family transcriptional regulator
MLDQTNESIGENAYRRMRADIIFGRAKPGQKLKLERLKDTYGASVSTLREILNRLSSEGLVVAEGQRGFEVSPVSAANLQEVAALRLLLETHALRDSFAAGDMEWEGRVVAAHHKLASMEKIMDEGDRSRTEDWKRYDWEFHQALISACGSRVLMETHAAVFDKYLRYQISWRCGGARACSSARLCVGPRCGGGERHPQDPHRRWRSSRTGHRYNRMKCFSYVILDYIC